MNNPGASGVEKNRHDSWLHNIYSVYKPLSQYVTTSNLIGLVGVLVALFLLLVPPAPWNIRLPLYIVVLVWTVLRPRVALYLLPIAIPWGSLDFIGAGGLRLNSADLLIVFLAIGWLLSNTLPANMEGVRDRTLSHIPRYLTIATVALLCVMLLSMAVAISKSDSLKEISKWLEFSALLLLGAQYIRTRRQLWTMIVIICLAGISQAFYGYIQYLFNLGPQVFVRAANLRVYGTFGQPNPFAGYINIPLSIVLALTLLGRNRITRVLAGVATILLGLVEYLTQSRGGDLAIASALIFIILVGMPQIRVLMRVGILAIFGGVEALIMGLIPLHVFNPILRLLGLVQISFTQPSAQDYSTAERLAHWIAGLRMYLAHPILGVGIGNYPDAYPQYFITIFRDPLGHAHNYYINIAAETGTIGLIVYLLFLLAIFVAAEGVVRNISKRYAGAKSRASVPQPKVQAPLGTRNKLVLLLHPIRMAEHYSRQERFEFVGMLANDRALAIGLFAAFLTVCVHNLFDDLYVHSLTSLIALLLIALIRLERVTPASPV